MKMRSLTLFFFTQSIFIHGMESQEEKQLAIHWGYSSWKNQRDYQEDRVCCAPLLEDGHFFGVYDGHCGDEVSTLLQKKLHTYFEQSQGSIKKRMKSAFLAAEKEAIQISCSGSTAVVAFLDTNNVLHLAWAGDSRAVVEKNGCVEYATEDHKPDLPSETARIKENGGYVTQANKLDVARVNGLAISRVIGDRLQKGISKSIPKGNGQIIAKPEHKSVQLTPENNFMIIATDGIWDDIRNDKAVKITTKALHTNPEELKKQLALEKLTPEELFQLENSILGEWDSFFYQGDELKQKLEASKKAWKQLRRLSFIQEHIKEDTVDEDTSNQNSVLDLVARTLCFKAISKGSKDNATALIIQFDWKNQRQ